MKPSIAIILATVLSPALSLTSPLTSLKEGYKLRSAHTKNFGLKSIYEVSLAFSLQLAAEHSVRGGWKGVAHGADFVGAALLTAVGGKYYSSWVTAPTGPKPRGDASLGVWEGVPDNAFTPAPPAKRALALVKPVPKLFSSGFVIAFTGYTFSSVLISIRKVLIPKYESPAIPVPPLSAALFTAVFMSTVSNLRYQLLQGLVEPAVDKAGLPETVYKGVIATLRVINGFIGSWLAVQLMRHLGLQRFK